MRKDTILAINDSIRRAIPFLDLLEPAQRELIEPRLRLTRVRKGQTLIGHGAASNDVFFIMEGVFRVSIFSANGREVSIREIKAGEIFGELAALDGKPRSASVSAVAGGAIVSMSAADFRDCIASSAKTALWLANRFAEQIRALTERIFELSALTVRSRFHCELLRLGLLAGVENNHAVIQHAPTHLEFSNRIGTHREAITRELSELSRSGIIVQTRRKLEILDVDALSRLVQASIGQEVGIYEARTNLTPKAKSARDRIDAS